MKNFEFVEYRPLLGGLYEAGSDGTIWRTDKKNPAGQQRERHQLKTCLDLRGYKQVTLSDGPKRFNKKVHSLVAQVFIGERPAGLAVNHIDGNKLNNRTENLEYLTTKENCHHARSLGIGLKNNQRITDEQIFYIQNHWDRRTEKCRDLAARFGVSTATISLHKRRAPLLAERDKVRDAELKAKWLEEAIISSSCMSPERILSILSKDAPVVYGNVEFGWWGEEPQDKHPEAAWQETHTAKLVCIEEIKTNAKRNEQTPQ